MEINGWPRHQLRAQGRLRCDPRSGYRKLGSLESSGHVLGQARRTDSKDAATRSTQLLNFLSKTAAHAERNLLQNAGVPDFAMVKNSAKSEFDVYEIVARKRQNMVPDVLITTIGITHEATPEGVLGRLASTIAEQALMTPSVEGIDYEHDFAIVVGEEHERLSCATGRIVDEIAQPDPFTEAYESEYSSDSDLSNDSSSALDLDNWFNCLFDPTDGDLDYLIDFQPELMRTLPLLPAALPPALPNIDGDTYETNPPEKIANASTLRQKFGKSRRERGKLFKRLVIDQPRIASLPDGERIERFENGAELKKDALGRVRHIRSGLGVSIAIAYDNDGQPQGFVRSDRNGQMHSVGERDRHGVVVRDIEGRVRAAGESMSVDPSGCLSVRRFDGQFWSLDLVKELHIERRSIVGRDGAWNFLTAVFASDGFRMMTRFQSLQGEDGPAGDRFHWLAAEPSGTFRFYGRDGSVIQFEGEDQLTDVKPQNVWAPGSRAIDPNFRGHHQAGTAWDSVQEYVTSYL